MSLSGKNNAGSILELLTVLWKKKTKNLVGKNLKSCEKKRKSCGKNLKSCGKITENLVVKKQQVL